MTQFRHPQVRPGFESRFTKVREFLAAVSTDRLDDFARKHRCQQPKRSTEWLKIEHEWQDFDRKQCTRFAEAWNAAWPLTDKAPVIISLESYDVESLRSRVESWTLQTLILTERPRDFSRYLLPRFTCVYWLYTTKAVRDWRNTWQSDERMPSVDSAIGEIELEKALKMALPVGQARHLLGNLHSNESFLITRKRRSCLPTCGTRTNGALCVITALISVVKIATYAARIPAAALVPISPSQVWIL